jgi:hypothetical protein
MAFNFVIHLLQAGKIRNYICNNMIFTSAGFIRMSLNKFCAVIAIQLPSIAIKGK